MSTKYRGHYLPVSARREVLRIYRDRRTHWVPITGGPLGPVDAMQATVDYFSGWLAHAVALGPMGPNDVENLTHQYRASQYYLERLYAKPRAFKDLPPRRPAPVRSVAR